MKQIADTGIQVSDICFGTAGLADQIGAYGYGVSEDQSLETINAIFDGPANFIDTSRNYGMGQSEERIGKVLKSRGGLPDGFVLSTKLDRESGTGRFDADQARRSLEESLEVLGLTRIPLLHLHDPEHARDLEEITCEGGALDVLFQMKSEGLCDAVGLAMGNLDIMFPMLRSRPFDALISHNRFTLLNQSANAMFDYAHGAGMAILNAAPFAGGVLAKGSVDMPRITYQPATDAELEPVRRIEAACAKHSVPVGAAALQFSMRDPRITSTLVGVTKPSRIQQTLDWAAVDVPQALWDDLSALPVTMTDPEADRTDIPG